MIISVGAFSLFLIYQIVCHRFLFNASFMAAWRSADYFPGNK